MKILVFGAGPLGSLKAARLHEAGHDVSLLARGQRLADLRAHGVVIREEGSDRDEVANVTVVESFEPDDDFDLVLVVMRKDQVLEILDTLADNLQVPTFLFMGNNAAGPDELVAALGEDRVMLGFPYPGGKRDGHVVRVLPINEKRTYTIPIGEVDGEIRPRTREVAAVLESMRGYDVEIRTDMDRWLRTHVALLISGFVPALYAADTNMKRLGETRDLLVLAVRATKGALRGLREAGYPPSPPVVRLFEYVPEPVWVWSIGWLMRREYAKVSIEGHSRQARGEMAFLYDELRTVLESTAVETTAMDRLAPYFDPETPPYPTGRRELSMRWYGLVVGALVVGALVVGVLGYLAAKARTGPGADSRRLSATARPKREHSVTTGHVFEREGGEIYYEVAGPPDAPAIVFTHGLGLDHETWCGQLDAFAGSYRVVAWDLPGCGNSASLQEPFRFADAADGITAILDAEGIDEALFVGQSLGSLVSQYVAAHHPERVVGLVHVGGYPLRSGLSPLTRKVMAMQTPVLKRIPDRLFRFLFSRFCARTPDARAYVKRASATAGMENMTYLDEGLRRQLETAIPASSDHPQVIVVGEHENPFIRKMARAWHDADSSSELITLPDAGHIANHDNPGAFNETLTSFLEGAGVTRGTRVERI